jgi:hypothetical protein
MYLLKKIQSLKNIHKLEYIDEFYELLKHRTEFQEKKLFSENENLSDGIKKYSKIIKENLEKIKKIKDEEEFKKEKSNFRNMLKSFADDLSELINK